jgi:hypothetical protein
MGDNVENAVFEILKKIQGDLATFRASVDTRFDAIDSHFGAVDTRIAAVETLLRKQRRDSAGMLVMTRAVSGDFEERVTDLEQRVGKLEEREH